MEQMVKVFYFSLVMSSVHSLNHGRDAVKGEYPFVVRIVISETTVIKQEFSFIPKKVERNDSTHRYNLFAAPSYGLGDQCLHRHTRDASEAGTKPTPNLDLKKIQATDSGRVSAGVLITLGRALTTCDTVAFFTGTTVNLYYTFRVSVLGGTVRKTGDEGQYRRPSSSSVHPDCYPLISGVVLFNYGLLEFKIPFVKNPYLSPVVNAYTNRVDMEVALQAEYNRYARCEVAGWGYPQKEFEGIGMPDFFQATSNVLQATNVNIMSFRGCYAKTCETMGNCIESIWEYGYYCAAAKQGGPCMNDKGAPLICNNVFYAIHTNQFRCDDDGLPRHFLRVDLAFDYVFGIEDTNLARKPYGNFAVLLTVLNISFFYLLIH